MAANGYRISPWVDKNILELVGVVAQPEYIKNHWIVHFNRWILWYVNDISIKNYFETKKKTTWIALSLYIYIDYGQWICS